MFSGAVMQIEFQHSPKTHRPLRFEFWRKVLSFRVILQIPSSVHGFSKDEMLDFVSVFFEVWNLWYVEVCRVFFPVARVS